MWTTLETEKGKERRGVIDREREKGEANLSGSAGFGGDRNVSTHYVLPLEGSQMFSLKSKQKAFMI